MAKMGTLPHYLYSNKISEVIASTNDFGIPADQDHTVHDETGASDQVAETIEQPDQFDASDDDDNEEKVERTETHNIENALDEGSYFLLGRSSRFGRAIKINSKLLS